MRAFDPLFIILLFLFRFQLFKELADAAERLGNMLEGIAVGNADVTLAGFTEGITGDDGNSLGFEEPFAEFLRGEAG